jgi:hypothetical protein
MSVDTNIVWKVELWFDPNDEWIELCLCRTRKQARAHAKLATVGPDATWRKAKITGCPVW